MSETTRCGNCPHPWFCDDAGVCVSGVDGALEWVWQGFYGPAATVAAAMPGVYADPRVGARVPLPQGEDAMPAPIPVDEAGEDAMFAVQTRRGEPVPVPTGCRAARPDLVGRMVGA